MSIMSLLDYIPTPWLIFYSVLHRADRACFCVHVLSPQYEPPGSPEVWYLASVSQNPAEGSVGSRHLFVVDSLTYLSLLSSSEREVMSRLPQ